MKKIKKLIMFIFLMCINIKTSYAAIKVIPSETFLGIDYSQNLRIANTNSNNISWSSSNINVVLVDNGKIIGVNKGEAYVKVYDGDSVAVCKVKVIDNYVPVQSVRLSKTGESLLLNSVIKLEPIIYPTNASNKKPTYISSNTQVASVDDNGYVTTKKLGTANISVSLEDNVVIYKITVVDKISLQGISVQPSVQLKPNGTVQLNVSYNPNNATDKDVTFSTSNANIATVSNTGLVRAKNPGTAIITVTSKDGGHVATSKITVINNSTSNNPTTNPQVTTTSPQTTQSSSGVNVKLRGIVLNKTTLSLNVNEEELLTVSYNPSDATDKSIIWKSSDPSVATVSDKGRVKAVSVGTTTISAISNDGHYEAKCTLTVNENIGGGDLKLKNIRLSNDRLDMIMGTEKTLEIIYTPSNAANKDVIWTSSDESVATVANGKIKALAVGTTKITVVSNDGGYEDKCYVRVYSNAPVENITFRNESETIYLGYSITLDTILTPEDSLLQNPIWTSSDESVATVNNGVVNALKVGVTTITVSDEKNEKSASIVVTVIKKPPDKLEVTIDGYDLNFDPKVKNYTLTIGGESYLIINTNYDKENIVINGNRDLKNGSIITITASGYNTGKTTYVINIKKRGFNIIYFIAIVSVILIVNLIRIIISNARNKNKSVGLSKNKKRKR